MVALVFISIITAFMVKATSRQSAAAISYGGMIAMNITTSSGLIATESYFARNTNGALEALDSFMRREDAPMPLPTYIYGNSGKKIRLADGQYFSSRIVGFNYDDPNRLILRVEIVSGRSADGRDLKTAQAFYIIENVKIEGGGDGEYNAKNAIFMGGDVVNADNGIEVLNGSATFKGSAKFQNRPAIFHGDAFFNKEASFMRESVFHKNAYFNSHANFQNLSNAPAGHITFRSDFGISGNLSTQSVNPPLRAAGDVYFGGDFRATSQWSDNIDDNARMRSEGANKSFFYTDRLSLYNPPPSGTPAGTQYCTSSGWGCQRHPTGHYSSSVSDMFSNRVTNFSNGTKIPAMDDKYIMEKLGMQGGLAAREDPKIDISGIDLAIIKNISGVMNADQLSIDKLRKLDAETPGDQRHNGHLVIKVNANQSVNFSNNSVPRAVFDGKVIFIVEGRVHGGNGFYHSGANSSTLMYVGEKGQMEQFGSDGLFRGLIYIHENNKSQNSFNWKTGSKIVGAIHNFSSASFGWNAGSAHPVPIEFDANVLNPFSSLTGAAAGDGEKTARLQDENMPAGLRQVGVYFD
jgi:hypothetical protein